MTKKATAESVIQKDHAFTINHKHLIQKEEPFDFGFIYFNRSNKTSTIFYSARNFVERNWQQCVWWGYVLDILVIYQNIDSNQYFGGP